ncbi:MAG: hypothetical protein HQ522_05810 [Bacteroidetes bacterium]|nr:hypothetical protein [Bacteroidota bacterium]
MKENLEKYLKENRLKLDADKPDNDAIWEGIRNGMDKKQNVMPTLFWKVAAILIFIISGTYFNVNKTKQDKIVIVTLADVSKELGNQETELKQLVNLKWEEIKPLLPKEKNDIQFLLDELNELDEVYNTYQQDLGNSGADEQIVTALLDYYQKKIRILNRILHEIQKQQDHENTITL